MNYIVLDMEWNQANSYAEMVKDPIMLTGEIVQIGAVKLDETFHAIDSFNQRAKPCYYREINPRVAEVTKLTSADLRKGSSFSDAFEQFSDWCGSDFLFLVWGTEDIRVLRKNMTLHDIETSGMPQHYNLQNIFTVQITNKVKQYSLEKALDLVHEKPFAAHDALNDAMSTVLICNHLDMARGLDEYQDLIEKRNGIVESYEFEDLYYDLDDVLSDEYVVSFECPDCGEIVWCNEWVKNTSRQLLSIAQCVDGKEYLVKLKLTYTLGDRIKVKRMVYELTEENKLYYDNCAETAAVWSQYVVSTYAM